MADRLKNLEIEIAYLRKTILELTEIVQNIEPINYYITNMYVSKSYLDSLTDDNLGE